MQNVGNVNNLANKDVIGGGYSRNHGKGFGSSAHPQDDDSISMQSYDNSVHYVDSLDDLLGSTDDYSVDDAKSRQEEDNLAKIQSRSTSKDFEEDMKEFESDSDIELEEEEEEEDYEEDSHFDADHEEHDSTEETHDNHLSGDTSSSSPIQKLEKEELETDLFPADSNSGSITPLRSRSPRKVSFNMKIETRETPTSEEPLNATPTSRSMERALERLRKHARTNAPSSPSPRSMTKARKQRSFSTPEHPKIKKAPTPYHKLMAREKIMGKVMIPRSPPLRTPPKSVQNATSPMVRRNQAPSSSRSNPSPEASFTPKRKVKKAAGAPFLRTSAMHGERKYSVSNLVEEKVPTPQAVTRKAIGKPFLRTSALHGERKYSNSNHVAEKVPTPAPKVRKAKKNALGLTIPEAPRLSTMEKYGVRSYSTSNKLEAHEDFGDSNPLSPVSSKKINKLQKISTFSELKNNYLKDFRHYSPVRDRIPGATVPKPFSFLLNDRSAFKRLINPMMESGVKTYRPFKASPMPNYDNDPFFHGPKFSSEKHFTAFEPFQLSHMRTKTKNLRKTSDDINVGRYRFKALPAPDFSFKSLKSSHHIDLTVPFPFHLRIDDRFMNRIQFHGTKRSNKLARIHVACIREKEKSSHTLLKGFSEDSKISKSSRASTVSLRVQNTATDRSRDEESINRTFKAQPMPSFSKTSSPSVRNRNDKSNMKTRAESPVPKQDGFNGKQSPNFKPPKDPARTPQTKYKTPSPASSMASHYSNLSSPKARFKAKQMPDFSKPFVPLKSPTKRGRNAKSVQSVSPISGLQDLLNVPKSAPSTPTGFRAKKMPNFSKPFTPNLTTRTRTPSPGQDHSAHLASRPDGPVKRNQVSQSAPSTPTGRSSELHHRTTPDSRSFVAKTMPNFNKPFLPSKRGRSMSPLVLQKSPASGFSARPLPIGKPFTPKKRETSTSPVVLMKHSNFTARPVPVDNPFIPEKRERQDSPVVLRQGAGFEARPMPNFSKPFVPLKRSTVEKALVKAVEDKNVLDILDKRLNDYKEKLVVGTHHAAGSVEQHRLMKDMTDHVVHKVLQDFVNKAKIANKDNSCASESQDFSLESLTNPSQDFSYIGDMSSSSNSTSSSTPNMTVSNQLSLDGLSRESLSHEGVERQLTATTDGDLSLATEGSANFNLSYSTTPECASREMPKGNRLAEINEISEGSNCVKRSTNSTASSSEIESLDQNLRQINTLSIPVKESDMTLADQSNNAIQNNNDECFTTSRLAMHQHDNTEDAPLQISEGTLPFMEGGEVSPSILENEEGSLSEDEDCMVKIDSMKKLSEDDDLPSTGLPPLSKNRRIQQINNVKTARCISILDDDHSECGSASIMSENGSADTNSVDTNEGAMPLLQVVDRLNRTMERLSQIEHENQNITGMESGDSSEESHSSPPAIVYEETSLSDHAEDRTMDKNALNEDQRQVNNIQVDESNTSEGRSGSDADVVKSNTPTAGQESASKCADMFSPKGSESQEDQNIRDLCIEEHDAALNECIEVDTGDKKHELRSPRGDFGDDFGSDTDGFRAGWTRALKQVDIIRLVDDETSDAENPVSNGLTAISEESVTEQSERNDAQDKYCSPRDSSPMHKQEDYDQEDYDQEDYEREDYEHDDFDNRLSNKVRELDYHNRYDVTDPPKKTYSDSHEIIVHRRPKARSQRQKSSVYDAIINCCTGRPMSPTNSELNLLEDESRDDDYSY